MALKLVTAPDKLAVDLDDIKIHLRVSHTDEDPYIQSLIQTATQSVEIISMHKMITQTWDLYLDEFPDKDHVEIPWPPLQSVSAIYYTPQGSSKQTWDAGNYVVDNVGIPGQVVLANAATWPSDLLVPVNGVQIQFICGFGDDPGDVDQRARQAIMLLVGHYYENREAVTPNRADLLPQGVHNLCLDMRMQAKGEW